MMIGKLAIRESKPGDMSAIETLYREAFPEEDLSPLVAELLSGRQGVLSLVGTENQRLSGHIVFTTCSVAEKTDKVALLGPLAVLPACQRQGIGNALIDAGLQRLTRDKMRQVFVLGDPAYYRRFGFQVEDDVTPPYPLPPQWQGAWRSLSLQGDPVQGTLQVPPPWRHRALWEE